MDTRVSSLPENLQECEFHPSSPSSAGLKNDWSYNSIPQYALKACSRKLCHYFKNNLIKFIWKM